MVHQEPLEKIEVVFVLFLGFRLICFFITKIISALGGWLSLASSRDERSSGCKSHEPTCHGDPKHQRKRRKYFAVLSQTVKQITYIRLVVN